MRITLGLAFLGLMAGCVAPLPDSRSPENLSGQPLSALGEDSSVDAAPTAASEAATISDEQDFAAVSSRESIESDAARLEGYRANYQQVQPEAVPNRPLDRQPRSCSTRCRQPTRSESPCISARPCRVTPAHVGTARAILPQILPRSRFWKAVARSGDQYGIDPDGDGFACAWDPAPFRAARGVEVPAATTEGVSSEELEEIGITTEPTAPAPGQPVPLPGETLNISTE